MLFNFNIYADPVGVFVREVLVWGKDLEDAQKKVQLLLKDEETFSVKEKQIKRKAA